MLCSDNMGRRKGAGRISGEVDEKVVWCVSDEVKGARCLLSPINESKHQTGCLPQVNPNFDTQCEVISPRCKYLLCNKRGSSTETDNYLLLWCWQNATSLTKWNWWLFHGASGLIWWLFFVYLFICVFFFLYYAVPEPRQQCGWDRQVHYMSPEFKVILCLLCLLRGAAASLRYSNTHSRAAKSSPISTPSEALRQQP